MKIDLDKVARYLKKSTPAILSGVASVGVVVTAVLASKASFKAADILRQQKKASKKDKLKATIPLYLPTAIVGGITIGCIIASEQINAANLAAAAAAYKLLQDGLTRYRDRNILINGESCDKTIRSDISKDVFIATEQLAEDTGRGEMYFVEELTGRIFKSSMDDVSYAEEQMQKLFEERCYVSLNDFYTLLGIECTDIGGILGWTYNQGQAYDYDNIEFDHIVEEIDIPGKGKQKCITILYGFGPLVDDCCLPDKYDLLGRMRNI